MEILGGGSKGQAVLDVQCALAAAGVFAGDLDGCFGPATDMAVKLFQSRTGLAVTGLLDEKTAKALKLQPVLPVESRIPAITPQLVKQLFPAAQLDDIKRNLPHVLNALAAADLTTPDLIAMALATIRTEASQFLPVSEKQCALNTSTGGKPFDLYDNRAVLGNAGAPDGANFRGRGFIQLTGRANYQRSGQAIGLGLQLINNPLLAHDPAIAANLLVSFLKARQARLCSALQQKDLAAARRVVNGGIVGLQPFTGAFQLCISLLPEQLTTPPDQRLA